MINKFLLPASRSALFIRTLSDFTFLHGPRHMYQPGHYLYEGGMGTRGPSPLTDTTSYAGTREFMRRQARVTHYNCLFARSIVTRRHGVGGVLIPGGKGLKTTSLMYTRSMYITMYLLHLKSDEI